MFYLSTDRWLLGILQLGMAAFCVTPCVLAQTPSSPPKVARFSQPKHSDRPTRNVVDASGKKRPGEQGFSEANSSDLLPAERVTEASYDAPSQRLSPVIIRFGQSPQSTDRQVAEPLDSVNGRPKALRGGDSRPAEPRPMVNDDPQLLPLDAADWSADDDDSPNAVPHEIASPRNSARRSPVAATPLESSEEASTDVSQGWFDKLKRKPDWKSKLTGVQAKSAVAETDRRLADAPRGFSEGATDDATSPPRLMFTTERRSARSSVPDGVEKLATTTPEPRDLAETNPAANQDVAGPTPAQSNIGWNARGSRLKAFGGTESASDSDQNPKPVNDVAVMNGNNSRSAATIAFAPDVTLRLDHLLLALLGGLALLLGSQFCLVIFSFMKSRHPREPAVKVEIINNGPGSGTAAGALGYSQTMTRTDSQPIAPDSPPRVQGYWQPAPAASGPAWATTSGPPAMSEYRPSVPEFARAAAPPIAQSVVQPAMPQITSVYPTKSQTDAELKQQRAESVARQVFEQNVELRQTIQANQNRAA